MAKKKEEGGYLKSFLKWSGLKGAIPSTFPDDKFEDVSESSSDEDNKEKDEEEEEDLKIKKVDFEDFCEEYHKWVPVSIGTFLTKCKKLGKKLTIERTVEFVISRREDEDYQEFTASPQKIMLLKSLLNKDTSLKKYKDKKFCLMQVILRSYEINYPLKIDFKIIIKTGSSIEDVAISIFSKTVNSSKESDIDIIFSATQKSKIDEQFIKCGFAKEDVLKFIKTGRIKKTPKKKTKIFPFHGNKKIHKSSFIAVWLLRNRYVEWNDGNSVSLYLSPATKRSKKKKKKQSIVRFEVDLMPDQDLTEPIDNSFITLDSSAYKSLKKNIEEFLAKLPYVNNDTGSIEISIDNITKEKEEEEKKEKINFKFSIRLEFLVQTDKSIDGREFPMNVFTC
jgi:hypothetical protein